MFFSAKRLVVRPVAPKTAFKSTNNGRLFLQIWEENLPEVFSHFLTSGQPAQSLAQFLFNGVFFMCGCSTLLDRRWGTEVPVRPPRHTSVASVIALVPVAQRAHSAGSIITPLALLVNQEQRRLFCSPPQPVLLLLAS